MNTITPNQLRDLAHIQHARSCGETPLHETPAWLAAERIETLEEQLAEAEIQTAQLSARLVEGDVERDQLAAHQADLVRELTCCQGVLHSLAHSGQVTPEYAVEAKAVLKRTKEASLARREANVAEKALRRAHEELSERKEWAAAHHLLLVASDINAQFRHLAEQAEEDQGGEGMSRWAYAVLRIERRWSLTIGFVEAASKDEAEGAAIRITRERLSKKGAPEAEWPVHLSAAWHDTEVEAVE